MKKSELKKLIYETVQEAISDILSEADIDKPTEAPRNQLAERYSLVNSTQSTVRRDDYAGIGAPKLKQQEIEGENYISGGGILEWFCGTKDKEVRQTSKASSADVDGLINRVMKK